MAEVVVARRREAFDWKEVGRKFSFEVSSAASSSVSSLIGFEVSSSVSFEVSSKINRGHIKFYIKFLSNFQY